MKNLTVKELLEVQGGNGGNSLSVYDNGTGEGCTPNPFKDILKGR